MPTIPVYQKQRVTSTASLPRKSESLPQSAFTSGSWGVIEQLGGNLKQLGGILQQRQTKLKAEHDELTAWEKFSALNDDLRILEKGEDGEGGYYSLKGSDAAGVTKQLDSDFKRLTDQYAGELENEEQVNIFKRKSAQLRDPTLDRMAGHEQEQHEVRKRQVLNTQIQNDTETALDLYNNPWAFPEAVKSANDSLKFRMELDGAPKEVIDTAVKNQKSGITAEAVIRLANDSPDTAKFWYQKAEKDNVFIHKDSVRVEDAISKGDFRVQSQAHTDQIMLKHGDDMESAFKEARKLNDPKIRDNVIKRVKARFAEQKRIDKETNYKITDRLTGHVASSTTFDEAMNFTSQAPTGKAQKQLEKYARWKFGISKTSGKGISNPVKLQELKERIDGSVQKNIPYEKQIRDVAQIEREYGPYISKAELNQGIKYFTDDGNIQFVTRSKLKPLFEELTEYTVKEKPESYAHFVEFVTRQLEGGEKPTETDLRRYASGYFMEGEKAGPGGIFGYLFSGETNYGEDMPYHEAREKGVVSGWLPVLDDAQRIEVEDAIKMENSQRNKEGKRSILVNDRNLRRFYKRRFMNLEHFSKDEKK